MSFSSPFESHSVSEALCVFELWVLARPERSSSVLYGRVVAKCHDNPSEAWVTAQRGHVVRGVRHAARVHRLHLTARACSIRTLILLLLEGKSLGDATCEAGLSPMRGRLSPHASCQLAPCYISRPVVFLEQHQQEHEQSPSHYMGMSVRSWIAMNKAQVLPDYTLSLSLEPLYEHLQKQTGVRFMGTEFGKLGHIDWYFSQAWNTHLEGSLLSIHHHDEHVQVSFDPQQTLTGSYRVAVQFYSSELIAEEVMIDAELGPDPPWSVNVPRALHGDAYSKMILRLYRQQDDTQVFSLVHTETMRSFYHPPLQESFELTRTKRTVRHHTGTPHSSGMARRMQGVNDVEQQRVLEPRQSTAFTHDVTRHVSWGTMMSEEGARARSWFPPRSRGLFLEQTSTQSGSFVRFVEWFYELLQGDAKHLLIADPFFDSYGLEILGLRGRRDGTYTVLTTARARPSEESSERGAMNVSRLVQSFDEQAHLLNTLDVRIFVLLSKAFHDRYVLTLNADRQPLEGYTLSNSIQTATRHYPLSITLMGPGETREVHRYLIGLMPSLSPDFSSSMLPVPPANVHRASMEWEHLPRVGETFAAWLGDESLCTLSGSPLRDALEARGVLEGNGFTMSPDVTPALAELLKQSRADVFNQTWNVLGEIWCHTSISSVSGVMNLLHELGVPNERLANYVQEYIRQGILHDARSLRAYLLRDDFQSVLHRAPRLNLFHPDVDHGALPFPVMYAIDYLRICAFEDMLAIVEQILGEHEEGECERLQHVGHMFFHELIQELILAESGEVIARARVLCESNVPSLRALGVHAILYLVWPGYDPSSRRRQPALLHDVLCVLDCLVNESERLHATGLFFACCPPREQGDKVTMRERLYTFMGSDRDRMTDVHDRFESVLTAASVRRRFYQETTAVAELIEPWLQEERVSHELVASVYMKAWVRTARARLNDDNLCFSRSDIEPSLRLTGCVVAQCHEDMRDAFVEELSEVFLEARRPSFGAFALTQSFQALNRARDTLYIVRCILSEVYEQLGERSSPALEHLYNSTVDMDRHYTNAGFRW